MPKLNRLVQYDTGTIVGNNQYGITVVDLNWTLCLLQKRVYEIGLQITMQVFFILLHLLHSFGFP